MSKTEAEQILKQLAEFQKKALSSKEAAREALYRAGLITKSGKPTKPYRRAEQGNTNYSSRTGQSE